MNHLNTLCWWIQERLEPFSYRAIKKLTWDTCIYSKTIIENTDEKGCLLFDVCDWDPDNCRYNPDSCKNKPEKKSNIKIDENEEEVYYYENLSEIRNNWAYIRLKIWKINYLIELNYKIEEDGKMKSANDCKKNTIWTIGKIKISIIDNKWLVKELIKCKYSDIIRSYIYINFLEKLVN